MRKTVVGLLLVCAIATNSGKANTTEQLARLLQRVDVVASRYTFAWEAEIEYTRMTSEKEKREMEQIARSIGGQIGRSCDGTVNLKGRGISIQRNGSECAILVDGFTMCGDRITDIPIRIYYIDRDLIFSTQSTITVENPFMMTYIWQGESPLYRFLPNMYLNSADFPDPWFPYGLLAGGNLFWLRGITVLESLQRGTEWDFRGSYSSQVNESFRVVSPISGKLIERNGVWLIKRLRIEQNSSPTFNFHQDIEMDSFIDLEGIPFPSQIRYEMKYELDGSIQHQKAVFRLVKIEKTKRITPDLPLNQQTNDLRLTDKDWYESYLWAGGHPKEAIIYAWEGRLPSLEELQQIAYQQGNLLPPESGRRRYSWVMFAPALVFLLLAAYLFWRGKRK